MSRAASQTARRAADAAPIFFALGDETRLRLLSRLSQEGPLSISRLSEGASITRQAVTKHLDSLERSGLLRATRRGRERVYEFCYVCAVNKIQGAVAGFCLRPLAIR